MADADNRFIEVAFRYLNFSCQSTYCTWRTSGHDKNDVVEHHLVLDGLVQSSGVRRVVDRIVLWDRVIPVLKVRRVIQKGIGAGLSGECDFCI